MYNINKNNQLENKFLALGIIFLFILSAVMLGVQLSNLQVTDIDNNRILNPFETTSVSEQVQTIRDEATALAESPDIMDEYLTEYLRTGVSDSNLKLDRNGDPVITVYAGEPVNTELINSAMNVDSFLDLGGLYLIMGSVSSPSNLQMLKRGAAQIYMQSSPLFELNAQGDSEFFEVPDYEELGPTQYLGNKIMKTTVANANGYDGTGVTVAVIDGGVDFGNSDLEGALALDDNGLPQSLDSEGWSLVATPLKAGTNITMSADNTTMLFSEGYNSSLALITNNGYDTPLAVWNFFYNVWAPKDWTIDPTWIDQPGQAAPKFGLGWQDIDYGDSFVSYSFFYALVLDTDADGVYESAVIDMATSAWVTYMYYIWWYAGEMLPMDEFLGPDFDFSNDKVVSWIANGGNTGADFTFAADWNNDGANDWSYGSMANAYNRFGFLSHNDTLYGKIVNGVDPDGSGFVALHPFGAGFASHGTLCASLIAGRGVVDYNLYNNNTGSMHYPDGNDTLYNLEGSAPGAELLSIAWGSSPQDVLVAWFWAAGFDLAPEDEKILALDGAQWTWSGQPRAQVTSNSWGSNYYGSGFDAFDWMMDLLSTPDLGAETTYDRWTYDSLVFNGTDYEFIADWIDSEPFVNVTNSAFYLAGTRPFMGFNITVNKTTTVVPSVSYEYWNGAAWTDFTPGNVVNWTSSSEQTVTFPTLTSWTANNFTNDTSFAYWMRIRLTAVVAGNLPTVNSFFLTITNPFNGYPGMLMVTSTGNDGYFQSTSSAFGTKSLKVGSFRTNSWYTIYGPNPDSYSVAQYSSSGPKGIGTPGVDILGPAYVFSSAPLYVTQMNPYYVIPPNPNVLGNGNYSFAGWQGTSTSGPAVAGIAALVYQAYMNNNGGAIPDPSFVKSVLKSTSIDLGYQNNFQGTGIANADTATLAMEELSGGAIHAGTFIATTNDTYENAYKANARQRDFFTIFGVEDFTYAATMQGFNDFPHHSNLHEFRDSILLTSPHGDTDLSAFNIEAGDMYSTQIEVSGNQSVVTAQAVTLTKISSQTKVFTNDTADFKDVFEYTRLAIDLSGNYSIPAETEFMEIHINTNGGTLQNWYYFDLLYTVGNYNGFEIGQDGSGHVLRGFEYMMKVGNPNRFSSGNLVLTLRPLDSTANSTYWEGTNVSITLKYFKNTAWSAVSISNSTTSNFLDVDIDTTGMAPGFHFGWISLADVANNAMVKMPLTIKVNYGELNGTGANPNVLGTYILNEFASDSSRGVDSGDLIWIPFSINETSTAHEGRVLVIKAEITNPGSVYDDVGIVLGYDDIPKYRGGDLVFEQLESTGTNVVWYYQPWGTMADEGAYWYSHVSGPGGMWIYKIGLFSNFLSKTGTEVEVSAYWIDELPAFETVFTDGSGNERAPKGEILTGTDSILGAETTCISPCADPNLVGNYELVFGVFSVFEFFIQEDYIVEPAAGTSIDAWIPVDMVAGDDVYLEGGDPDDIDDHDIFIYTPSSAALYGYPSPLPELLVYYPDFGTQWDESAIEYTTFTAPETGTYWIGMDRWEGNSSNYFLYVELKRGNLAPVGDTSFEVDTKTNSDYSSAEGRYDPDTGSYDISLPITIGVATPTNLESMLENDGLVNGSFFIDFEVAPTVTLSDATKSLDLVDRVVGETSTLTLEWTGSDPNSDSLTYYFEVESLSSGEILLEYFTTSTSIDWKYSDLGKYLDGNYKLSIYADDGVERGGQSDKESISIKITTVGVSVTDPQKVTVTKNVTVTAEGGGAPGFELVSMLVIVVLASVATVTRRRK